MPWSLNLDFSFSYSENNNIITRNLNTNISARVKLTKNWNISYRSRLDLIRKEIVNQHFTVQRDLHCWVMNFSWSPNPSFSYYRLEIRVKENILRDLKLTKTGNVRPL